LQRPPFEPQPGEEHGADGEARGVDCERGAGADRDDEHAAERRADDRRQ
jgi:hypothetical protein